MESFLNSRNRKKRFEIYTDPTEINELTQLLQRVCEVLPITTEMVDSLPLEEKKYFSQCFIHADINDTNVLFSCLEEENWKIKALLDFGDSR